MSLDEANEQELVDMMTESQTERPEIEETLKQAIHGVSDFLYKPSSLDEFGKVSVLYQYEDVNQAEFNEHRIIIDQSMSSVYNLSQRLTQAFYKIESTPDEQTTISDETKKAMNPQEGILQKLKLQKPVERKPTTLGEAVEDPYIIAYDMKSQVKNVPNLWKKFTLHHETSLLRKIAFDIHGLQRCLDLERWYFKSFVQPNIMQIIIANMEYVRSEDTERVARVLTQFYQQKEKHRMDMPPQ